MNDTNEILVETVKLPLWENVLDQMRQSGLDYGKQWPVEFFESGFRTERTTPSFAFEMMALRREMENEDGYYLKSSESGRYWSIVQANACEDVAHNFEIKMKRYANRAVSLRLATLSNEKAILTESERRKMEANAERAAHRMVLLGRKQQAQEVQQSPVAIQETCTIGAQSA